MDRFNYGRPAIEVCRGARPLCLFGSQRNGRLQGVTWFFKSEVC